MAPKVNGNSTSGKKTPSNENNANRSLTRSRLAASESAISNKQKQSMPARSSKEAQSLPNNRNPTNGNQAKNQKIERAISDDTLPNAMNRLRLAPRQKNASAPINVHFEEAPESSSSSSEALHFEESSQTDESDQFVPEPSVSQQSGTHDQSSIRRSLRNRAPVQRLNYVRAEDVVGLSPGGEITASTSKRSPQKSRKSGTQRVVVANRVASQKNPTPKNKATPQSQKAASKSKSSKSKKATKAGNASARKERVEEEPLTDLDDEEEFTDCFSETPTHFDDVSSDEVVIPPIPTNATVSFANLQWQQGLPGRPGRPAASSDRPTTFAASQNLFSTHPGNDNDYFYDGNDDAYGKLPLYSSALPTKSANNRQMTNPRAGNPQRPGPSMLSGQRIPHAGAPAQSTNGLRVHQNSGWDDNYDDDDEGDFDDEDDSPVSPDQNYDVNSGLRVLRRVEDPQIDDAEYPIFHQRQRYDDGTDMTEVAFRSVFNRIMKYLNGIRAIVPPDAIGAIENALRVETLIEEANSEADFGPEVKVGKAYQCLADNRLCRASTGFRSLEIFDLWTMALPYINDLGIRPGPKPKIPPISGIVLLLYQFRTGATLLQMELDFRYHEKSIRTALDRALRGLSGALYCKWWGSPGTNELPPLRYTPDQHDDMPKIGLLLDGKTFPTFRPSGSFGETLPYFDDRHKCYGVKRLVGVLRSAPHYAIFSSCSTEASVHDYKLLKEICGKPDNKIVRWTMKHDRERALIPDDSHNDCWAVLGDSGFHGPPQNTPNLRLVTIHKPSDFNGPDYTRQEKIRLLAIDMQLKVIRAPVEMFFGRMMQLAPGLRKKIHVRSNLLDIKLDLAILLTNQHIQYGEDLESTDELIGVLFRELDGKLFDAKNEHRSEIQKESYTKRAGRAKATSFDARIAGIALSDLPAPMGYRSDSNFSSQHSNGGGNMHMRSNAVTHSYQNQFLHPITLPNRNIRTGSQNASGSREGYLR